MNSLQFNVYLGIISFLGYLLVPTDILSHIPKWISFLFLILLYSSEFWAFLYKLKIARVRNLIEVSKGNPHSRVGQVDEPGCMLFYAFLIRFVFRFAMIMFAIILLTGEQKEGEDLPWYMIILLIVIVLFELFNMMYSLYETHIFRNRTSDDDESDEEEFWKKEAIWREKNFKLKNDPSVPLKLTIANVVLLISAAFATAIFWNGSNAEFADFISRSAKDGQPALFVILFPLIASFVLCLFFLMPVRLAFWIEQLMNADTPIEKKRYRWSIVFAGISITAPVWIQVVKTYILGL